MMADTDNSLLSLDIGVASKNLFGPNIKQPKTSCAPDRDLPGPFVKEALCFVTDFKDNL